MKLAKYLADLPGVILGTFPSAPMQEASGTIVNLGSGKTTIAIGDWGEFGMLMFLPKRKAIVVSDSPSVKQGTPEYEAMHANTVFNNAGCALLFANIEAVNNLRRQLDSVERHILALAAQPKDAAPCRCELDDLKTGVVCKPCGELMPADLFHQFTTAPQELRDELIAEVSEWQRANNRGAR